MGISLSHCILKKGNQILLEIENICFPQQQTSVIIGPNGAGKSTLIKQLLHPQSHAQWQGQNLQIALKRGLIAWVGQHENFSIPFTLLEYVLMGCYPRLSWYHQASHQDQNQAWALLKQFDLAHLAHQRLLTLSGGEKQRAAIARALLQATPILLLDEPTNHLDIRHQYQLMHHLYHLPAPKPTIIMVLHDLNLAARYSDFVVLMKQGRIIAQGATAHTLQAETLTQLYDWPIQQNKNGTFQAASL